MLTPTQTPAIITSLITLRFDPPSDSEIQVVTSKQLDSLMRIITVKLNKGGGSFEKPQNAQIRLRGTKPDGTVFDLLPLESDEIKGIYSFALTKNILSVSGDIFCDVVCSILADETYICSTEVFVIRNIAAAVDTNVSNFQSEIQTIDDVVYRANVAADNANSATASALNAADTALSATDAANSAADNANGASDKATAAADIANQAANSATKAASTALAAAENCPTALDLKGFALIKSCWTNPDCTRIFHEKSVTFASEQGTLFYIIKFHARTNDNFVETRILYANGTDRIVLDNTSSGANRRVTYSAADGMVTISFTSDAANGTFFVPCEIYSVSVRV